MGDTKICRYCGNVVYKDAETCEYCGSYLLKEHDRPDLFCKRCKAEVNTDDNFCQHCGAVFNVPGPDIVVTEPNRHNTMGIPYHLGVFLTSIAASFAVTVFFAAGKEDATVGSNIIFGLIAFIVAEILLYIYFLPSIIAIENNNRHACMVYVCNLLLGVTIVGWFVALVLAMNSQKKVP